MVKEDIAKIELPDEYKEGLIDYTVGLDNIPDWPTLQANGWSFKENLKLNKLVEIEHMKYSLKEAIEDNEISENEILEAKKLIEKAINEYNNIKALTK